MLSMFKNRPTCGSRYYDPEVGRFLNTDAPGNALAQAHAPDGLNLTVYCGNNPVNRTDHTGNSQNVHNPRYRNFSLQEHPFETVLHNMVEFFRSIVDLSFGVFSSSFWTISPSGITAFGADFSIIHFRMHVSENMNLSLSLGHVAVGAGSYLGFQASLLAAGIHGQHVSVQGYLGSIGLTVGFNDGTLRLGASLGIGGSITVNVAPVLDSINRAWNWVRFWR